MSHSIQWDNAEKSVVLQQYTENAAQKDLYDLSEQSAELLKSVSHTVHLIIDERPVKMTLSSADLQFLEAHVPPNQGAVVVIVDRSGLNYKKRIQDVGKSLAPKTFEQPYFVESLEEARQFLQQRFGVHYP